MRMHRQLSDTRNSWMLKMKFTMMCLVMFLTHLELECRKCSSSEYLTQDGLCCRNPPANFYIIKNCSLESSISALPCSTCSGKGIKILTSCTRFSDTKCDWEGAFTTVPGTTTELYPNSTMDPLVNILVPIAVVLLFSVIVLFVGFYCCLQKCRKTGQFLKFPHQV